jgi:hypothetical protein
MSNVFVFKTDGTIRICGGKVVVDLAFCLANIDFIIKSGQNVPVGNPQLALRAHNTTSIRQASEWRIRQFQASFPRMKDKFSRVQHTMVNFYALS